MDFRGEHVAVVGLGRSNIPLVRFLMARGARVTAFDQQTAAGLGDRFAELQRLGVSDFSLGPGYLDPLPGYSRIFLTPGMPKHLPQIVAARTAGARISGEIELVLQMCRAPVVGITGSAGKTTTTTLIGAMLQASGHHTVVGGNIGTPLIEQVAVIPPTARVVLELSSFQLHLVTHSPQIAVVTNVSPNHLDVHASMDEYVDAKRNIFRFQNAAGRVVLNADHPVTRAMAAEAGARAVLFSRQGDPGGEQAAYLDQGSLFFRGADGSQRVLDIDQVRLLGEHNVENVLAAMAAALLAGATVDGIDRVTPTITGVEHRLELVRELAGVRFYNDSKATAPVETAAALRAITGPVVLIAGGYDKMIPFDDLGTAVARSGVHTVVLTGPTATAIAAALTGAGCRLQVYHAANLAEAVTIARASARPGDTVLLSPACASYDQYRNFEERGRHFKDLVGALA